MIKSINTKFYNFSNCKSADANNNLCPEVLAKLEAMRRTRRLDAKQKNLSQDWQDIMRSQPAEIGMIGEIQVKAELERLGFYVIRSNTAEYDLIATRNGKSYRVEVKSTTKNHYQHLRPNSNDADFYVFVHLCDGILRVKGIKASELIQICRGDKYKTNSQSRDGNDEPNYNDVQISGVSATKIFNDEMKELFEVFK